MLHAAGAGDGRRGPGGPGAVHLPHEGPGPGPAGCARGVRPHREIRQLRRRHAPGRAAAPPGGGPGPAHQPGHAARGDPPAALPVDRVPQTPQVRGPRRHARLPRRVRKPRREHPPPAGAGLPAPGRRSADHLHLGHRGERGAVWPPPDRAAAAGDRRRRGAPGAAALRAVESPGDRPGDDEPAERLSGGGLAHGRAPPARCADHRLHQGPEDHRAGAPVHRGRAPRIARAGRAHQPVPRRLPPRAAARDRAAAVPRRPRRGRQHQRAGTGDRRWRAGRVDPGGVSRNDGERLAAGGARRPGGG